MCVKGHQIREYHKVGLQPESRISMSAFCEGSPASVCRLAVPHALLVTSGSEAGARSLDIESGYSRVTVSGKE